MPKALILLLVFLLLAANTPWFFTVTRKTQILGFPPWALYSLIMMVLYSVIVAGLLSRYWERLSAPGEEEGEGLEPNE